MHTKTAALIVAFISTVAIQAAPTPLSISNDLQAREIPSNHDGSTPPTLPQRHNPRSPISEDSLGPYEHGDQRKRWVPSIDVRSETVEDEAKNLEKRIASGLVDKRGDAGTGGQAIGRRDEPSSHGKAPPHGEPSEPPKSGSGPGKRWIPKLAARSEGESLARFGALGIDRRGISSTDYYVPEPPPPNEGHEKRRIPDLVERDDMKTDVGPAVGRRAALPEQPGGGGGNNKKDPRNGGGGGGGNNKGDPRNGGKNGGKKRGISDLAARDGVERDASPAVSRRKAPPPSQSPHGPKTTNPKLDGKKRGIPDLEARDDAKTDAGRATAG